MPETPTLVTVRFLTSRASLCGCHLAGIPYPVTPEFARQVVEMEHVAEYVGLDQLDPAGQMAAPPPKRRRG